MAKNILKTILLMLLIMIGITLLILEYYMLAEIETKEPKETVSCNIKTEEYKNRKVFIVTPKEGLNNNKKILYFHGGSYMAEASKNHWEFIEKLVTDTGSTLIMPDYPLAPKYNYKDVFEMIEPLYKEISSKIETENLIVMGDSAGAGLALALVEKISGESILRQRNIKMPSKTILISPWVDTKLTNPEIEEVQKRDTVLNKETLKLAGIAYSGKDGQNSYLVNPIQGDLSKIGNVTIFVGTEDILTPDSHLLKEKASKVGTNIEIKEYKEAKHIWMIEKNSKEELVEQGYQDILSLLD